LTSDSSNASSSGTGTSRSTDSGTSYGGSTLTMSEGGSSNKNTRDIPGLHRELARHFHMDNQYLQLSLISPMQPSVYSKLDAYLNINSKQVEHIPFCSFGN